MRAPFSVVLVAAFALALTSVSASHCSTYSTSTMSDTMIVVDTGLFWVVADFCLITVEQRPSNITVWFGHEFARVPIPVSTSAPCQWSSPWIYFETNGIAGLQRGDSVVDDTCHSMIESDSFLW